MNALANSQLWELEKYLRNGYGPGREPVTFARYTGQESQADRDRIRANPPDILLTNYVMLELMLTRPDDRRSLIRMARGLEFLVFDEMHTYRGRQGADVALLIRRVKDACEAENVQCVGTSATMATEGTSQRAAQGRRRRRVPDLRHPGRRGERDRRDPHPRDRRGRRPGHARADRRACRARRLRATWSATRSPAGSRPRSASTATTRASSPAACRPPSSGRPATWRPRPARTRTQCEKAHPAHPAGRLAGQGPAQRPAAVRVPAAPVPVQGRHRVRDARRREHAAHHPRLPGRAARLGRQGAAAAGVLPRVRPGVPGRLAAGPVRHGHLPGAARRHRRRRRRRGTRRLLRRLPVRVRRPSVAARHGDGGRRPARPGVLA